MGPITGDDSLDGGKGDDVLIFTTTGAAGSTDVYDGSKGYDTVQIVMSAAQHRNALFQQELTAYQAFLLEHSHAGSEAGPAFTFASLGLTLSNFETIEVVIDDAVNTAPVAADDAGAVTEDAVPDTTGGNVLANDVETDALDVLSVSSVNGSAANVGAVIAGTYGTLTLNADGSWSYTLDNSLAEVQALAEGEQVIESFSYAVTDGTATDIATLNVTVSGAADGLIAEPVNLVSVGTTGGARMIAIAADGTMTQTSFLPNNGGFAYGTALGDINGDGETDLLMSGDWSGAVIYYGDGAGGFTNAGVSIAGQFQSQVEIADIDNDGDGDFYIQNGLGDAEVWRNDAGSFSKVFTYTNIGSTGSYRTSGDALFADVNGDGAVDLLINEHDGFTHAIADKLFINDGSGNFTAASSVLPTATGYANMVLADIDNDGDVDYLRGTATGVAVAVNDGAGNFASPVSDLGAEYSGTIAVGDFNADGILDVARDNKGTGLGIEIWLGDGADSFIFDHTIASTVGVNGSNLLAGDFSGDGIADLVYTDYTSGAMVTLINDGAGNFTEADALTLPGFIFGPDIGLL